MGEIILRDNEGRVLIRELFGASANHRVPGVFEDNGDVNNAEVNEGLDVMREAVNSESHRCVSDFHWSWENFGRDSFACVQPDRLPQGSSMTEQYGVREVQHVQMEITEEGRRPAGPFGLLNDIYTTPPRMVPVTVRWGRDGHISIFREDIALRPPAITPPAPPPPPQPDPIADAFNAASSGIKNFFSGAATRVSQTADSAIRSLRSLIG